MRFEVIIGCLALAKEGHGHVSCSRRQVCVGADRTLGARHCRVIVRWTVSYSTTSNLERQVGFPYISLTDRYTSEEFVSEQLKKPRGIAVDQDGFVYVSDEELCAVLVFGPQGDLVRKIGGIGSRPGEALSLKGIAINDNRL